MICAERSLHPEHPEQAREQSWAGVEHGTLGEMASKWVKKKKKKKWPKHKSLHGNVGMKITWMAAISLLNSPWSPAFLELIKGYKWTMPAVCMEPISGICYVTVSFLQSHSIFCALGRALCSCQPSRISVLYSELLSCQQGWQWTQCAWHREISADFPPCVEQIFLLLWTHLGHVPSFWDLHGTKRLLLLHSVSRCDFRGF